MNPPPQNARPARTDLDRLLRSAAQLKDEAPAEMPFGFDTRVIALSRRNGNGAAFGALLRRVALAAAAVIILAPAGAWLEFIRDDDVIAASGHGFVFADSSYPGYDVML